MNKQDDSFKDFVLDQLQKLDGVEARAMFGGFGLYQEEIFFGIVHAGRLYFKVNDSTVTAYRKRKMKPFRPNATQTFRSY
jgi:DNA transformation protein and related proteins